MYTIIVWQVMETHWMYIKHHFLCCFYKLHLKDSAKTQGFLVAQLIYLYEKIFQLSHTAAIWHKFMNSVLYIFTLAQTPGWIVSAKWFFVQEG